jgi:hypothetical protein
MESKIFKLDRIKDVLKEIDLVRAVGHVRIEIFFCVFCVPCGPTILSVVKKIRI